MIWEWCFFIFLLSLWHIYKLKQKIMKAKILLIAVLLTGALKGAAQNDVALATLQHGDEVSVFKGPGALANALAAADEGGGDVITLSEGVFTSTDITKPVSIYGAGYKTNEATGTLQTEINGDLTVGRSDNELLSNVHLEGLYVNGCLYVGGIFAKGPLSNFRVEKSHIMSVKVRSTNSNTSFDQCIIDGVMDCESNDVCYKGIIADLYFSNCVMNLGRIRYYFHVDSSVVLDHCIFNVYCTSTNSYGVYWPFEYSHVRLLTLRNTIYVVSPSSQLSGSYTRWPSGSKIKNCISDDANIVNFENCYYVGRAEIFKDGEDGSYSYDRTYELNQPSVWLDTDGNEIGLHGGNGWSKVPSTPVVKNMSVTPDGTNLNVTYEAEVR